MAHLSERFASVLLAPPVMTRGIDEFSAVFRAPGEVFDFTVALNEQIWPLRFRVGVGVGAIDVAERSRNAARMDGPAFHRAAAALTRARDTETTFAIEAPDAAESDIRAIEALALAHATIADSWTPAVARIVVALRRWPTGSAAARELGITQQAVSRARRRASLAVLQVVERATADLMASRVQLVGAEGGR